MKNGVTKEEMMETMSIATLVGGTIVIPHLRRAVEYWELSRRKHFINTLRFPTTSFTIFET